MTLKPETKVTAGAATAAVSGAVSYVLAAYVFRGSVPPDVQALVPVMVSVVLGAVAAWLAPHTHRPVPPAPPVPPH